MVVSCKSTQPISNIKSLRQHEGKPPKQAPKPTTEFSPSAQQASLFYCVALCVPGILSMTTSVVPHGTPRAPKPNGPPEHTAPANNEHPQPAQEYPGETPPRASRKRFNSTSGPALRRPLILPRCPDAEGPCARAPNAFRTSHHGDETEDELLGFLLADQSHNVRIS